MESQLFFSKPYVHVLLTIVLVGVIASLGAYAYYTLKQTEGVYTGATSISIQGEGEVDIRPDIGTFSFSVLAEGVDAKTAQTKSAESINAIIASLKEAGVEEKDIKTENYTLNPKYTYEDKVCAPYSYCPPSNPKIDGYEVSQSVTVKVRDLDKAGDLISLSGEKGATNISSLQFTVDDESKAKAEARAEAIADAKKKADELAKDLGVKLVRMTGYWEEQGGGYPMPEYGYGGDMMMESKQAMSADMPVGQNVVKAVVTITYEVK